MNLVSWRPHASGTLRGFVTVELEIGLIIPDIKVFDGRDGAYVQLPDKPALEGGRLKCTQNGQPIYYPALKWCDRQRADKFSSAVIKALAAQHPEALVSRPAPTPSGSGLQHAVHERLGGNSPARQQPRRGFGRRP